MFRPEQERISIGYKNSPFRQFRPGAKRKEAFAMTKKRFSLLILCAALSLLLAGCSGNGGNTVSNAASKVGDVVSKAGEDVNDAVSRVESFLEGDDDSQGTASTLMGDDGVSSLMDDNASGTSSLDGDVSSGASDAETSSGQSQP